MSIIKPFNIKDKFITNLLSILIIILPISLISGPFIPDLSISIISIFFIYLSIKNNLKVYYLSNFSKFFVLFYLALNISSLFSVDPIESFKITFVYFRFYIFSLAFWYIIEINPKILINLLKSFIIGMVILIIDGFYQVYFTQNIFGAKLLETRVSSLFQDELILGSYLSRVFPIFFALLIFNFKIFLNKKLNLILIFLILTCIEVLTFLSGERAAFFYINLSAIYLIIMMKDFKLLRFCSLIFSLVTIFLITTINSVYKERMVDRTIDQLNVDEKIHIFSQEHRDHYQSGMNMFSNYKMVGIGPRMFRENCHLEEYQISNESCTTHPHNNYIQIITEAGILGIIFYIIPLIFLLFYSFKHFIYKYFYKKILFSDFQLSLLSCFLITLWPLVPTGDFFNNWLNVIYYFPLGIFLASLNKKTAAN